MDQTSTRPPTLTAASRRNQRRPGLMIERARPLVHLIDLPSVAVDDEVGVEDAVGWLGFGRLRIGLGPGRRPMARARRAGPEARHRREHPGLGRLQLGPWRRLVETDRGIGDRGPTDRDRRRRRRRGEVLRARDPTGGRCGCDGRPDSASSSAASTPAFPARAPAAASSAPMAWRGSPAAPPRPISPATVPIGFSVFHGA